MGNYCTEQDLIDRFGEGEIVRLTNPDDLDATAVDSTRLDQAIADAEATIDGYLAGPYTVPLSPVPRVITKIGCDLARYELYDEQATCSVARGEVSLGPAAGGGKVERDDRVEIESGGRTFDRDGKGSGFL